MHFIKFTLFCMGLYCFDLHYKIVYESLYSSFLVKVYCKNVQTILVKTFNKTIIHDKYKIRWFMLVFVGSNWFDLHYKT